MRAGLIRLNFIMLIAAIFLAGCSKDEPPKPEPKYVWEAMKRAEAEKEADQGPCCMVTGEKDGLDIYINGIPTGKVTPDRVEFEPGDLIYLTPTVEMKTSGFLVTEGEVFQNGAWVADGEELFVKIGMRHFEYGRLRQVNTGNGFKAIGADFTKPVSDDQFGLLPVAADNMKVLYADKRSDFPVEQLKATPNLLVLDLSDTDFSDLKFLRQVADLRMLAMARTKVMNVSEISKLGGLRVLDLEGCPVMGVSPFDKLKQLRTLVIRRCPVKSLSGIQGAGMLESLDIRDTKVKSLSPLSGLTNLRRLYASGTKIKSIAPVAGAGSIEVLLLNGTGVSDVSVLRGKTALKVLDLAGTGVKDIGILAGCAALEQLKLDSTGVTDLSPLASLTNLRELSLNGLKPSSLEPLKNLTGLSKLRLIKTEIPEGELEMIFQALPDCRIVGVKRPEG